MYINQIDNLFDGIINNFNIFSEKKKVFDKFSKDQNYVKYQNDIVNLIKDFTLNINNTALLLVTTRFYRDI